VFQSFHFLQRLPTISFLLLHSLHLLHLFIFFTTPLSFLSTKASLPSFFSSHLLILSFSQTLSFSLFLSSSPSIAPKAKKSSYVLSSYAFHLIHWSGATRLVGPPPLTYQPENHIPMGESVSFSFFFSLSSFPMIFGLNVFLTM